MQEWRQQYGNPSLRPALTEQGRAAGALNLRTPAKADGSPAAIFAAAEAMHQVAVAIATTEEFAGTGPDTTPGTLRQQPD